MTSAARLLRFRSDVIEGRARAWRELMRSRGRGLEREIDRACLHALEWDAQINGDRADWLFELATIADRTAVLRPRLLRALRRSQPLKHSWTLLQRVQLAARFAERGDVELREAVVQFVRRNADEFLGHADDALLRAAGAEGLSCALHALAGVALRCESRPTAGTYWWEAEELGHLLETSNAVLGRRATERALRPLARTFPILDRLRQHWLAAQRRTNRGRARPKALRWSREQLERILSGDERMSPVGIRRWSLAASRGALDRLDRRLQTEDDEAVLKRLLAAFQERPMAHGIDRALILAAGRNAALADAALTALAPTLDPCARSLASTRIASGPSTLLPGAIAVLARRPLASDWALIERRCARLRTRRHRFEVSSALFDWVRRARQTDAECALTWIWDHVPCSHCRASVLQDFPRRRLPRRILREALHDASREVRQLGRRALA